MNNKPQSNIAIKITPAFQAFVADAATNYPKAMAMLAQNGHLQENERQLLSEFSEVDKTRLLLLSKLLSERRYNRASKLLPASHQLLGAALAERWSCYLAECTLPGMPSASQDAVHLAKYLQNKDEAKDLLTSSVLRYEELLNEVSCRVLASTPEQENSLHPRELNAECGVRLSPLVIVEAFDLDIIHIVKALRTKELSSPKNRRIKQFLIFKPSLDTGLVTDVINIPKSIATVLFSFNNNTIPLSQIAIPGVSTLSSQFMTILSRLVEAGILIRCNA